MCWHAGFPNCTSQLVSQLVRFRSVMCYISISPTNSQKSVSTKAKAMTSRFTQAPKPRWLPRRPPIAN